MGMLMLLEGTAGDDLVALLQYALDTWGEQLSTVYNWLSTSSADFSPEVHSWVSSLQTSLTGIGEAFCLLFFWIGFFRICGTFTELKRPEVIAKHLIRMTFAMFLVHNIPTFLVNMEDIGIGLAQFVTNSGFTADPSDPISIAPVIEEAVAPDFSTLFATHGIVGEDVIRAWDYDSSLTALFTSGLWDLKDELGLFLLALLSSLIMRITALACGIYLKGVVIMRYFLMYIAQIVGVLAVSTIASQSTQNHAIQFFKYYAGLCLRMFSMSIIIMVYYKFVTTSDTLWNMVSASTPSTPSEAIWATLGWFFLVLVPFMMTMITSDRILKEALAL